MQFITLAAFAASAAAGVVDTNNLTERDLATIETLLSSVGTQIVKLDNAVKSYSGGSTTAALSVADDVVDALTSGKTKVASSSELGLTDAAELQGPVGKLTAQGKSLVSDLESKRSLVEKAGQCSEVRSKVNSVNSNGQDLVKAVVAKVPSIASSVASQLAAPLVSLLNKAADDFSTDNCKDSGSSSGGNSAASSSASATETSTATSTKTEASSTATETSTETTTVSTAVASTAAATTPATSPTSTDTSIPPNVTQAGAGALAPAAALAIAIAAMVL